MPQSEKVKILADASATVARISAVLLKAKRANTIAEKDEHIDKATQLIRGEI